ncbi:hypothetical protein ACFPRL_09825 [Pseudoclavibacter helvolus]
MHAPFWTLRDRVDSALDVASRLRERPGELLVAEHDKIPRRNDAQRRVLVHACKRAASNNNIVDRSVRRVLDAHAV